MVDRIVASASEITIDNKKRTILLADSFQPRRRNRVIHRI